MSERARALDVFDGDEVREVLRDAFYRPAEPASREAEALKPGPVKAGPPKARRRRRKPKPDHYEVICISLYKEDLARLDEKVKALKASGHRKMSRSALIRYALDTADLEGLPKAY